MGYHPSSPSSKFDPMLKIWVMVQHSLLLLLLLLFLMSLAFVFVIEVTAVDDAVTVGAVVDGVVAVFVFSLVFFSFFLQLV